MVRTSIIALLLLVCTLFVGCQSYTTGLQNTAESANDPAALVTLHSIATAQANYLRDLTKAWTSAARKALK